MACQTMLDGMKFSTTRTQNSHVSQHALQTYHECETDFLLGYSDSSIILVDNGHTLGYPIPLPIVRLVLICKAMNFAHKPTEFA